MNPTAFRLTSVHRSLALQSGMHYFFFCAQCPARVDEAVRLVFHPALGAHIARRAQVYHDGIRQRNPATIAILQTNRPLSTETSTPTSRTPIPPPGFNINEAKKPIPVEKSTIASKESLSTADSKSESISTSQQLQEVAATTAFSVAEKNVQNKKPEVKLTLWQKVKKEAIHYWDGTKLLGAEIKISWKLALKMAGGYELTRREYRQVHIYTLPLDCFRIWS